MPAKLHVIANTVTEIPFQDASMDIWDTKYRLKTKDGVAIDATIDETYQRVARALSEVEKGKTKQEQCYKDFLWALRQGAIPAGGLFPMPEHWNTNRPHRRLTAPYPAPSPIPWTIFWARYMKPDLP